MAYFQTLPGTLAQLSQLLAPMPSDDPEERVFYCAIALDTPKVRNKLSGADAEWRGVFI